MAIYTAEEIIRGPGKLFWDVTPPLLGEGLTIDSDGNPVTVPPSGILAGWTKEGTTLTRSVELVEIRADQVMRPVQRLITNETVAISGTLVQLANSTNLERLTPGASNQVATAVGHMSRGFGGRRFINVGEAYSVCVTFRNLTATGGYSYFMVYRSHNWQEFALQITRRNPAECEFRFEGESDPARPFGDRIGRVYI
jgi:hypothetical protein